MPTTVIALIFWTVLPAGIFYCLPCLYRMVRVSVLHHRNKVAAIALRNMKYNDIRRGL